MRSNNHNHLMKKKNLAASEVFICFIVSVILRPLKLCVSHKFTWAFLFFLGESAVTVKVYSVSDVNIAPFIVNY